jgi:xylulokinase
MPHAMGIDVGTTNAKVVLVGSDGEIIAAAARALKTRRTGEVAEQDAEELWRAVRAGISEVAVAAPAAAADVVVIGCCSQYSSIVPVDHHGSPVADMVLWQDTRGADYCQEMLAQEGALDLWLDRQRFPPVGEGLSLAHILHLQNDRPHIHSKTTAYLEPMDYVNARLTGRIAANHCTMFMSQLCDNRSLGVAEYDDQLLDVSGVDPTRLPPLSSLGEPAGQLLPELASELGLPDGVVVMAGMNDSHADAVATGALMAGRAGLAIGTTSVLVDLGDDYRADVEHYVLSMPSPFNSYLVWAETGIGGRALEFVLDSMVHANDEMGDHRAHDLFTGVDAVLSGSSPGSHGLLFLPWLNGSLSPQVSPSTRGAYLNLNLETRRSDLIRATAEGVAHNLRWLLPYVEAFTGRDILEVAFVGGAARSAAWSQILADVLDRPVLQMPDPDRALARGVALFALHLHGDLESGDPTRLAVPLRRFEPSPKHQETYSAMQEQFAAAFTSLQPIFGALNS